MFPNFLATNKTNKTKGHIYTHTKGHKGTDVGWWHSHIGLHWVIPINFNTPANKRIHIRIYTILWLCLKSFVTVASRHSAWTSLFCSPRASIKYMIRVDSGGYSEVHLLLHRRCLLFAVVKISTADINLSIECLELKTLERTILCARQLETNEPVANGEQT